MTEKFNKNIKDIKMSAEKSLALLEKCRVCPRNCNVNRLKNEEGFCKTGFLPRVYSYQAHFGEEPVISGDKGSGTIFFSMCNMSCVFCQNHQFSQHKAGKEVSFEELADIMLELQAKGCHNINLVTPSHNVPQIINAIAIARDKGLDIDIVYNSNGYDSLESLKLLDGIVDIYLPDLKYADDKMAEKYSNVKNYVEVSKQAVLEMYRQVGDNLIIRHLVMPHNISGTDKVLRFIRDEISKDVCISLMGQYYPCNNSYKYPELAEKLSLKEYKKAYEIMFSLGLDNGWVQEDLDDVREKFIGENIKGRS